VYPGGFVGIRIVPGYPRTLATFNRRRRSLSVSAEAQENLRDTTKPMRERLGFARAILEGFRDGLKS
jgi:hypothetical protein